MKSIYVIDAGIGPIKVGIATDPGARARTIQGATTMRTRVVHATEARKNARAIEALAHRLLRDKRRTGEWFDVTVDEAIEAIQTATALIDVDRRRGRPPLGDKKMVLIAFKADPILVERAKNEARSLGVSLTDVYRRWFYRGSGGEAA